LLPLPLRAGKQCRERWHNQLRPEIKRDPWMGDEEEILIEAHRRLGNKCVHTSLIWLCSSLIHP
jgi:hypothetical protein